MTLAAAFRPARQAISAINPICMRGPLAGNVSLFTPFAAHPGIKSHCNLWPLLRRRRVAKSLGARIMALLLAWPTVANHFEQPWSAENGAAYCLLWNVLCARTKMPNAQFRRSALEEQNSHFLRAKGLISPLILTPQRHKWQFDTW